MKEIPSKYPKRKIKNEEYENVGMYGILYKLPDIPQWQKL